MYHSITFAPIDMDMYDIIKFMNIERYAADERSDPEIVKFQKILSGEEFSDAYGQIQNTWKDWHLVPATRPTISPPALKSYTVDIPNGYGVLDLTEALVGHPLYERRTGSMEFIVMNDFGLIQGNDPWDIVYTKISNYLHGKQLKMILEDDLAYYYEGRFTVNEWRSEKDYSRIVISYDLHPFKRSLLSTSEPWLWDPFDFETGEILSTAMIGPGAPVYIIAGMEYITPVITSVTSGTLRVAKMLDYPCREDQREQWISHMPTTLVNADYKDYTLTEGINRPLGLEIGGNYVYGFQLINGGSVGIDLTFDWGHRFHDHHLGDAEGTYTVSIAEAETIHPVVTVDNDNIIPNIPKYRDFYPLHVDGAQLELSVEDITTGDTVTHNYTLNNGANVLDDIAIPSGGANLTFSVSLYTSNDNAQVWVSLDGRYITVDYRKGEL